MKGKTFAYFWEKNVIHVKRENIQKATGACRVDSVTSCIGLSPGVGPSSKASLGNQVKNRLVRVVFTGKETNLTKVVAIINHQRDIMTR